LNLNAGRAQDETNQEHRVGLLSVGLETYWDQFGGLRKRLLSYNSRIARSLKRVGTVVENLGMIDNVKKAVAAGHALRQRDVDTIFLHVATCALSSTVLPIVRRAKVPVILLNLSPVSAVDYSAFNQMKDRTKMTGECWGVARLVRCRRSPTSFAVAAFRSIK
jgi:L-arabinose isomerase